MIQFKDGKYVISSQVQENHDLDLKASWQAFDKIFCIHYLPYRERIEAIKDQLQKIGILNAPNFEFYFTVSNPYYKFLLLKDNQKSNFKNDLLKIDWKYEDSEIKTGIDLCHLNISNISLTIDSYNFLKICLARGFQNVLVIEDDVFFLKDSSYIKCALSNMPKKYDVINFNPYTVESNSQRMHSFNKFYKRYQGIEVFNMSCVALSRRAIQHIVDSQEKILEPFDRYTWKNAEDLQTYLASKPLCIQSSAYDNRQNFYMRKLASNINTDEYYD